MPVIRRAVVAGSFYPKDENELRADVARYLAEAERINITPKALIVPHAGYVYSGPIAGSAYAQLSARKSLVTRVVLVGPSHRVAFAGLATTSADFFMTPLGEIPVDRKAVNRLLKFPQVREWDVPHGPEHCLEVQLPFLQEVLGDFSIVPLVVGEATPDEVAEPLECLWGGPETLFVISSDLSHYHDYATARRLDYETANAIEQLQADRIGPEQACGCRAVGGLLSLAKRHDLHVTTIDLRNSGDTSGPRDEVVGYGAFAVV